MRLPDCDTFHIPVGPGAMVVDRYGYGDAAVVLLHGFGCTSFLWRHVGPALAVRRHVAVAPDLFGYGASDRPFDAGFGIGAQAGYVRKAIAAMGLRKPAIVGCDISALIALRVAAEDPKGVGKLVLVSPAEPDDLPGGHIRRMQRETARHVLRLVGGLFGAEPLIRVLLETSVSDPGSLSASLIGRYVAPYLGREGVNHLLVLAHSLDSQDVEDVPWERITNSTLILRGDADPWCSEEAMRALAGALPGARCEVIAGAGRLVAEDKPEALATAVLAHLDADAVV
jgi:pimeloyl-ACP methyl ester carboxylesterase